MSTLRSQFFVDDKPLTIPGQRWVNDEHKMHGPQNIEMEQVTLPGRDGEIPLPATMSYGAATWDVAMSIQGDSYDQLLERKGLLERNLTPPKRLVKLTEKTTDERGVTLRTLEAYGYLTGSSVERPWNSPVDGIDVVYTFRIPSGVWLEPAVSLTFSGIGNKFIPAALGGSAPQHDVVFTLYTTGGRVEFEALSTSEVQLVAQAGNYVRYTDDNNPSGRVVEIRARDNTAVYQASPIPILVNNNLDAGNGHFYIHDGQFTISKMAGVSSVKVSTRKAWY